MEPIDRLPAGPATAPALVSQRRGAPLAVAFVALACAGIGILTLVSVVRFAGDSGRARVVGPVPGSDQLRLEVLDGPDPKTWLVRSGPYGDPAPGAVIDVTLGGSCRCAPLPPRGSVIPGVALGVVLLVVAALGFRSFARTRSGHRNQAAAARRLAADADVLAVRLAPSIRARKHRVSVRVVVTDLAGDALGELDLGGVHGDFDPHGGWWLVGQPWLGSVVALVSQGRRQILLPISPLQPVSDAPRWSATALALLGWSDRGTGPGDVPVLPSHGRVGLGSGPAGSGTPGSRPAGSEASRAEAADRLWEEGTAAQRSAGRQVTAGFVVIFLLALFGGRLGVPPVVLIAGGAVAVAAFNAAFRRRIGAAARRNLDLDAADQPFAVDIAAAVVAWHHPAQPAPPFVRHLPATAT